MIALRRALLSIGMMLFFAAAATAEEPLSGLRLDIRAQPIGSALNEFAKQTGLQVFLSSDDAAGHVTLPLTGTFTPQAALDRLLTNTGLSYQFLNEKTVAVRTKTGELEKIGSASGEREGFAQPVDEIHVAQSATASPITAAAEGAPKGADEDKSTSISEIVVTAQKRSERLQDVPISISVLGGKDLDRSTAEGISEALNRVPGVATTLAVQTGGTQLAVRGVTASGPTYNGSSPIAYYVDSVPFGLVKTAIAPDANAYDLERIEVLRGPQGTLYGANAMNGVVRVLTKDADPDQFEFKVRTSGSFTDGGGENYRGDMAVNAPIVEGKLAARAVLGYQSLSGWIDRLNRSNANDAEIRNARLRLDAHPVDKLSVGLSAWLSRADYGAPSLSDDSGRNRSGLDESIATDFDAFGFTVGYEFPWFAITSMSSYLDYSNDSALDIALPFGFPAGSRLLTSVQSTVISQEVILNSTQDRLWRWSLGAMYRDAEDRVIQDRRSPSGRCCGYVALTDLNDISESVALFGEVTRLFFDGKFALTGGLRYFEDDAGGREYSRFTGVPATQLINSDSTFDALSPRVVATWHPSDQMTVYASYAEGFRSGFDQTPSVLQVAPDFPPADADTLRNYEMGAKATLWDGRVSFDTALFYIDWQDVKQTVTTVVSGVPLATTINGDSASGIGADFGATIRLVDGLELGINFNWNDLKLDTDVFSRGVRLFEKGARLNLSPEYTVGAFSDYVFPFGTGSFAGRFSVSANYISEQEIRALSGTTVRHPVGDEMLVGRASFSIDAPNHWSVTLFVDNISNEQGSPVREYLVTIPDWDTRIRPRTVGAQLEYSFGR